eukprot:TRINITY_DN2605_c0_g1_i1.p1 TRINITY_DN2605_c0_g1~~TRINITY_DN2605_c0_g1_i1.p1  ORF type:complete len:828 (-),score=286.19 TRINITY_DN2605_c0_g1_i1:276-2603(-)
MAQVNQYFNRIALDEQVWETVWTLRFPPFATFERVMDYLKMCPELKTFDIEKCSHVLNDEMMATISQKCPSIMNLLLGSGKATSQAVLDAVKQLDRLEELHLQDSVIDPSLFTQLLEDGLRAIHLPNCGMSIDDVLDDASRNPALTELDLSRNDLSSAFIDSIPDFFPNLEILKLEEVPIPANSVSNALTRLDHLKRLDLGQNNCIAIHFRHDNIESLDLEGSNTSQSIQLECPKLQELKMDGKFLNTIRINSENLNYLDLHNLPCLTNLALNLPSLTDLYFAHCGGMDQVIPTLNPRDLPALKKIRFEGEVVRVRSSQLSAFCQSFPKLAELSLIDIKRIREISLKSPNLRSLTIRNTGFTDFNLNCPNLESLTVNGCKDLWDNTIFKLKDSFFNLKSINFNNSDHLSHDGILQLLKSLRNLEEISAENCPWITSMKMENHVIKIFKLNHCKGLEEFQVESSSLEVLQLDWAAKIKKFNSKTPKLSQMSLDGAVGGLEEFSISSETLKEIKLSGMLKLEKFEIDCPNLQSLSLIKCVPLTEELLYKSTSRCSQIREIEISGCKEIKNLNFQTYPNVERISLGELRNLTQVSIPNSCQVKSLFLDWCAKINDTVVSLLTQSNPMLTDLRLLGLPMVKSLSIRSSSLERLSLEKCLNLKSMVLECSKLYRFQIKLCKMMTSAHLNCSSIKVLDIDELTRMVDLNFESFSSVNAIMMHRIRSHVPNLVDFKLKSCKVEEKAVNYALESFAKLNKLKLEGCDLPMGLRAPKRPKLDID